MSSLLRVIIRMKQLFVYTWKEVAFTALMAEASSNEYPPCLAREINFKPTESPTRTRRQSYYKLHESTQLVHVSLLHQRRQRERSIRV
jgi:hypothetical protein